MRDIIVTLLIFGSLPFILRRPYIGVLAWAWISYMNPHRLTWGFAYDFPFAQLVAIVLFASLLFSKESKKLPMDGVMGVWIAFLLWMTITTIFAIYEDRAFVYYIRVVKVQLLTLITIVVMTDQKRIDLLIWTICLSIGFYSVKGGIFTLATAGSYRVWGPGGSWIFENNAMALATLLVIPLMIYLHNINTDRWIRLGLKAAVLLSFFSALGSQSRGALVATIAVAAYYWWQTKSKFVTGAAIFVLAVTAFNFMPASWHERMGTIDNYEEDSSANSRLDAWRYSAAVASQRLTGGGFNSFSKATYAYYYKPVPKAYVSHSIYFSVIAAHGWPGFIMFMTIIALTWRNLSSLAKQTRNSPEDARYFQLAKMLKVSLIAYLSGGAFLSLAYFDLPWHIVAIAFLSTHQYKNRRSESTPKKVVPDFTTKYPT
ncbi:putative O-glycosylation ligase, exosortase A system-associated [Halieaceae bacterium IMCC14734]|uniref:O-glycosylation ligase, exosortase A system-associated n=1 Tax=Candidatus Litorirhabdus singularis TaxID=2518993 RepID=A0ABT3TG74_9GAMM|nr:putative O-glycosylation ligase, exosortase A system-associated [Candidatus Litorirhabdus singularis]MCX2981311.1 putative O-glycosylation ligase, exosortase A system-associated [Candidatus Litorirhabdus singularis]